MAEESKNVRVWVEVEVFDENAAREHAQKMWMDTGGDDERDFGDEPLHEAVRETLVAAGTVSPDEMGYQITNWGGSG